MLSFFTDPYPDELLYSAFARYHFYAGNKDFKDTLTELFGKNTASPSFGIGTHLQFLCNELGAAYSPEKLIQKHSIFPFYSPFLPAERKAEIITDIMWSGGQGLYTKLGIVAGSICRKDGIYYCSTCAKENIGQFGEPYIHREHQLQGVLVCPHHGHFLKRYAIKPQNKSRIEFVRLEEELLDLSEVYWYQGKHQDLLWKIARAAYYLLSNEVCYISKSDVLCRYKRLLYERSLITASYRVRQEELHELVTSFYGADFLELMESGIDKNDEYNWLRVATRNIARTVHPLRHILLILYLVEDMDAFWQGIGERYNPFGAGPWPCLNNTAKHYRQDVIERVIITADYKTRKPVGTFTCECGYSYSRTGPDKSDKDRYRKGRIKAFGHDWIQELRRLIAAKTLSYRKMALYMGCDVKTIRKFESNFTESTVEQPRIKTIGKTANPELLKIYKTRLAELVIAQQNLSRTGLRRLCQKEYAFLYRHDREWLLGVLPRVKIASGSKGHIDWQKRDREVFEMLYHGRISLLSGNKPVRINKSSLGKIIDKMSLLEKCTDKLPCCSEFIATVSETKTQFQLRRCQHVMENMKRDGQPLIEWKIQRQAGLRQEDFCLLKGKLDW